ncbi:ATP-binding protein [Streptomyces albus subsp. chlorinus]|uniref:ATP-binding protein n=1 Tax=Streptomyces albus TaxID=1888 RepID=UPI00156E9029|nr:ATP-binding protein [Streptomyces albus]NSC20297.1 ATP-binding protein [Streptomyces albus subsp. chlorinus]
MEFQALPSRIGQVRRIISAQLRYWRLDSLVDATALGLTELLTNVHQHAETDGPVPDEGPAPADKHCTVELSFMWNRLTVLVHDHDPRLPRVRGTAARERLSTNGRGLALVAAISESWGMRTRHDGSGKTVWFSLPVPPRPAAASTGPRTPGAVADGAGPATAQDRPADAAPAAVPPPAEVETAPAH